MCRHTLIRFKCSHVTLTQDLCASCETPHIPEYCPAYELGRRDTALHCRECHNTSYEACLQDSKSYFDVFERQEYLASSLCPHTTFATFLATSVVRHLRSRQFDQAIALLRSCSDPQKRIASEATAVLKELEKRSLAHARQWAQLNTRAGSSTALQDSSPTAGTPPREDSALDTDFPVANLRMTAEGQEVTKDKADRATPSAVPNTIEKAQTFRHGPSPKEPCRASPRPSDMRRSSRSCALKNISYAEAPSRDPSPLPSPLPEHAGLPVRVEIQTSPSTPYAMATTPPPSTTPPPLRDSMRPPLPATHEIVKVETSIDDDESELSDMDGVETPPELQFLGSNTRKQPANETSPSVKSLRKRSWSSEAYNISPQTSVKSETTVPSNHWRQKRPSKAPLPAKKSRKRSQSPVARDMDSPIPTRPACNTTSTAISNGSSGPSSTPSGNLLSVDLAEHLQRQKRLRLSSNMVDGPRCNATMTPVMSFNSYVTPSELQLPRISFPTDDTSRYLGIETLRLSDMASTPQSRAPCFEYDVSLTEFDHSAAHEMFNVKASPL